MRADYRCPSTCLIIRSSLPRNVAAYYTKQRRLHSNPGEFSIPFQHPSLGCHPHQAGEPPTTPIPNGRLSVERDPASGTAEAPAAWMDAGREASDSGLWVLEERGMQAKVYGAQWRGLWHHHLGKAAAFLENKKRMVSHSLLIIIRLNNSGIRAYEIIFSLNLWGV